MPLLPPRLRHIKLQHPVLRRTMPALAYVANLNASASTVIVSFPALGSCPKPHRIPHPLPRQPPATLRVPKVAKLPQLILRWGLTLMFRRRALSAPPASQRKPPCMQPSPVLQLFYRQKKRTRHQPPLPEEILKCEGLPILLTPTNAIQCKARCRSRQKHNL